MTARTVAAPANAKTLRKSLFALLGAAFLATSFSGLAEAQSATSRADNPYRIGPGPKFTYKPELDLLYLRLYGDPVANRRAIRAGQPVPETFRGRPVPGAIEWNRRRFGR